MAVPPELQANLRPLAAGADFGVRFTASEADWNAVGSQPTLVLIPPNNGTELTPSGTVSVDGTEYTVTVLGSVTANWEIGK